MSNTIQITRIPGASYILVEGVGMWTPDQVLQHFQNVERDVRALRARCGMARVLADMSGAQVQTAAVAQLMNAETARIYREHDRVAIICATKLVAIQVKRTPKIYAFQTFTDYESALAWLVQPTAPPPAERPVWGA